MLSAVDLFQPYRRKLALCLAILWIGFVVTFPFTGYYRGLAMGCFDVITGRPQLLVVGLPIVGRDFGRMIEQRYGVHLRLLGCVTNSMKDAYVDGYNRVVCAAVKHKYGVSLWELGGDAPHRSSSIAKTTVPFRHAFLPNR